MRRRPAVARLLSLVLLATGCGSLTSSNPPPANLSAPAVAARYFAAVSKGDWATAHGCLDREYDHFLSSAPDSDFYNLDSLSNVWVGDGYPAGHPGGSGSFADTVEVAATFDARYKQVSTVHSGRQTRFLLLGRHRSRDPWLIFGIGTGP